MNDVTTGEKIIYMQTTGMAHGSVPYLFAADCAEATRQMVWNKIETSGEDRADIAARLPVEIQAVHELATLRPENTPFVYFNLEQITLQDGRVVVLCPMLSNSSSSRDVEICSATWYEPAGGQKLKQSEFYALMEAEGAAPQPAASSITAIRPAPAVKAQSYKH